ncbi:hypothetical protein RKD55_004220 [Rossellomorea marisflavi]
MGKSGCIIWTVNVMGTFFALKGQALTLGTLSVLTKSELNGLSLFLPLTPM